MRILLTSCLFLFVLMIVMPAPVHAELIGPLDPIFPEACRCESVPVVGSDGEQSGKMTASAPGYGCVLQVVQNLVRLVISLGIVIATLALVYTGFQWITAGANAQKRTQGKNLFLNTLVGLVIILTAWLIVDFVMKTFYAEETTFGPWNSILAGTGSDQCLVATKPKSLTEGTIGIVTGPTPGGGGTGVNMQGSMTHQEASALLAGAGVEIKPGASLNGTQRNAVLQIAEIKQSCGCSVTVTSGTDGSHASGTYSHANGYKVDLRINAGLDSFLTQLTRNGSRSNGDPIYNDRCRNEYVREGDHWDITVTGVCSL